MLLCGFVFAVMATAAVALPGTCDFYTQDQLNYLFCYDFTSSDDLAVTLNESFRGHYQDVHVENMNLNFIRFDTFMAGFAIKNLFIENSTFDALTDRGRAFMGTEGSLSKLIFSKSTFKNRLDWGIFNKFEYLNIIGVIKCNIGISGIENLKLESLEQMHLNNSGISKLPSKAFAGLKYLETLSLVNNKIRILESSMFPTFSSLRQLDLSNNNIERIPEDLFRNLIALRHLFVSGNKLLTLQKETYSPIWHNLVTFETKNSGLLCDFNLCWLLKTGFPKDTVATCEGPSYLRGRNITSLTTKELYC